MTHQRSLSRATMLAVLLTSLASPTGRAQTPIQHSALHDYRVVTVAEGLLVPWAMAFLPGGDMLVTERAGRLRLVRGGQLLPDPVPGVPPVRVGGQGGEQLVRLTLDEGRVVNSEQLLQRQGRIRVVREAPDGHLYVAFESRTGATTRVVRLEPVARWMRARQFEVES